MPDGGGRLRGAMLNDLLAHADLLHWKPAIRALLLPPVPLLLLALALVWWPGRRWRLGLTALLAALYLLGTPAVGAWLIDLLTEPPPPLSAAQRQALTAAPQTAVLVLGGGRYAAVPELDGAPDLTPLSLARLRHGARLARETGLPLGFSGGLGHGASPGADEASVAARIAQQEFGVPLRWQENRSRDTLENARLSTALLHRDGIRRIVLVTDATHQRRALAAFARAAAEQGVTMTVQPATMGLPDEGRNAAMDWVPAPRGALWSWLAFYEWFGQLGGA